jgi:hypothetical protein
MQPSAGKLIPACQLRMQRANKLVIQNEFGDTVSDSVQVTTRELVTI